MAQRMTTTRSGRNVRYTEKMVQFLQDELSQVELQISQAERQLSGIMNSPSPRLSIEKEAAHDPVDRKEAAHDPVDRKEAAHDPVDRKEAAHDPVDRKEAAHDTEDRKEAVQNRITTQEVLYEEKATSPMKEPSMTQQRANYPVTSTPKYIPKPQTAHYDDGMEEVLQVASNRSEEIGYQPSSQNVLEDLASILRRDRLPRLEPEVFSGDLLTFPAWLRSFETLIESQTSSSQDRLYYLGKYTSGDAKTCICGYFTINSPDAYQQAKEMLTRRYGDKFKLGEAFKKQINEWPTMKSGDGAGLRKFSDFLQHCKAAMTSIKHLQCLDSPEENHKLIAKLPRYLADRWSRKVDAAMFGSQDGIYPPFQEFCEFISTESRILCGPGNIHQNQKEKEKPKPGKPSATSATSFMTDSEQPRKPQKCYACDQNHEIQNCTIFLNMRIDERKKLIHAKGLCFGCLRRGHVRNDCKRKGRQLVYIGLQTEPQKQPSTETAPLVPSSAPSAPEIKPEVTATSHKTTVTPDSDADYHSLIVPVILHCNKNPHIQMRTYALLDNQSNACFVTDDVLNRLCVTPEEMNLKLTTLMGCETLNSGVAKGLVIRGVNESTEITLPDTYQRDSIPVDKGLIPRRENLKMWPHLRHLEEKLEPVDSALDIGLLIGFNCTSALLPREVIAAGDNEPYGVRTTLGWGIVGPMNNTTNTTAPKFAFRTHVKEVTPATVKEIFDKEYSETSTASKPYSVEDTNFMNQMNTGIHQKNDDHFELPLPFKGQQEMFPNNKPMVLKRFNSLKARLIRDEKYHKDYHKFMTELIENGHAEKVPIYDINNSPVWYIPHHGIYHPKKPEKLRVVFDCSAEFMGHSLNKHLLQGPDMTNNLTGVLCRFRKEKVALVCDIEGMFHQVHVNPEHRDYLRFLWTDDLHEPPSEYRMTVHLFGATSSPGAANFALKTTAEKFEQEYKEAATFVKRNFYVDDGITSVATVSEAIDLFKTTRELCKRGGFNLHKFASTDKAVLEEIPTELQAKELQNLDFSHDMLPTSHTLGVQWSLESDEFQFTVGTGEGPVTRRGILSSIASTYDPLGLLAPITLTGRKILQEICRDGNGWDDPVPSHLEDEWMKWKAELPLLSNIHVRRCYKNPEITQEETVELHHFSDASQTGYGQCSYLRIKDDKGNISTSLVIAKSRVTPSKLITIPRLELMAATLSVKIAKFLHEELDYSNISHVFWTDSKVVLGYIANDSRRFHVFVANRIKEIREFTNPAQWHYVNTNDNPADLASRGITAAKLPDNKLWWYGPSYLMSDHIPTEPIDQELSPDDPEIKKKSTVLETHAVVQPATLLERLTAFSSWHRACRAVAVCLKLVSRLKSHTAKKNGKREPYTPVTVEELQKAEKTIIKLVQQKAYSKEIKSLRATKRITKKESKIHRLDPFLCDDGILRVGGRIKRASLNYSASHPAIIPKESHIAQLLIAHFHEKYMHPGSNNTLSQIRIAGFWIVKGRSQVSGHIRKCVICRKLRGGVVEQKMADLPVDRLEPCPPFTYSAVDLFGPYLIKEGRSEKKRWGAIFVCMVSRAIHIEVVNSLSTDSFINAYRRFICRRGPIRMLRCDRGTNFVGAKHEFDNAVRQKLLTEGCDYCCFKMNFPHSSHMGGAWERMIRTVRNALAALLIAHPSRMDDELLRTLFTEAEAIVNSRPLTYYNTDDLNEEPLTPMQILTLKSKVVLPPPGTFVKEDLYCRKRWRVVQYMANQFWQRWIKEFLPTLQERGKWQQQFPNIEVGDIVMVMDDLLARCQWPKGRVTAIYPSEDGLVRKVSVKIRDTVFERPVQKLILLFRPT